MNSADCQHLELTFGSGDYYVFCKSCPARWVRSNEQDIRAPELSNLSANNSLSGEVRKA